MPRRGKSEQYALNGEQVKALIEACESLEDRLALKLMAYLGMRVSEVAHLCRDWVNSGEIRIPASQPCDCASCKGTWSAKSKASVRVLPVPELIANDLYTFLHQSPEGFHITRVALWWKVKRIAKKAGIKTKGMAGGTISPHILRATAATHLASHLTASELCYLLGWESLEMGEHYINLAQAKAGAHQKVRELLRK